VASDKKYTVLVPDQNLKNIEFDLTSMTRADIDLLFNQLQTLHTMFQETIQAGVGYDLERLRVHVDALSRFGHSMPRRERGTIGEVLTPESVLGVSILTPERLQEVPRTGSGFAFQTDPPSSIPSPEPGPAYESELRDKWARAASRIKTGYNSALQAMANMVGDKKIGPAGDARDARRDDTILALRAKGESDDESVAAGLPSAPGIETGRGIAGSEQYKRIDKWINDYDMLKQEDKDALYNEVYVALRDARERVSQGLTAAYVDEAGIQHRSVDDIVGDVGVRLTAFKKEAEAAPTVESIRANEFAEGFKQRVADTISRRGGTYEASAIPGIVEDAARATAEALVGLPDTPEGAVATDLMDVQLIMSIAQDYLSKKGGLDEDAAGRIAENLGLVLKDPGAYTVDRKPEDTQALTREWTAVFLDRLTQVETQADRDYPGGLAALKGNPQAVLDLVTRAADDANSMTVLPEGVDITAVSNTALIEREAGRLLAGGLDPETQAAIHERYGAPPGATEAAGKRQVFTQDQTIRTAWMEAFSADFNARIERAGRTSGERAELRNNPAQVEGLAKLAASTASSMIRGSSPEYRNLTDADMMNMDYFLREVGAQLNAGLTPEMQERLQASYGLESSVKASDSRLDAARAVKDGLAARIGDGTDPMTAQEAERIFGYVTNTLRQLDDDGRPLDRERSAQEVELLRGFEGLTVDQAQRHAASIIDTRAAIREAEREKENLMFTRAQGLEAAEEARTRYGREEQMGVRTDIRDMQQRQQEQTTGIHRAVAAAQQQMASEYLGQAPMFGPVTPGAKIGGANIYEQLAGSRGIVDPGYLEYGSAVPSLPQASDMQAFHEALASARAKLAYGTEAEAMAGLPEYTPEPGVSAPGSIRR
tara:strand:+ start:764 stop:3418 length:2655 start_codon:yes stop_codon:yes gene_type:complete